MLPRGGILAEHEAGAHLKARFGLSERRACRIAGADRRMVRYQAQRAPDMVPRGRLRELANERRRFGSPLAGRRFATQICREAAALALTTDRRLFPRDLSTEPHDGSRIDQARMCRRRG
ncbi:MAG: hypothetical protein CML66_27035 [Rhodobacteraceae bacterium]|nr:hypothetical protein [Paracoccaceae bacterium]MAY46098.1 hypothetical protein [Paracoccaceae bacterium]|tara:strand:+ start:958 stop:1314 length:357 start_codon:yes stop_codon:yes gene_type:complete